MIRSCADAATHDLFRDANTKAARRIPRDLWRVAQRKLKQLDLATRLADLDIPPANRLEALKGDQRGRHSIRVNDQYRITFRWEGIDAYEVCCEDYHA
jgi:toxin HigB-1